MSRTRTSSIRRQLLIGLMVPIISLCFVIAVVTFISAINMATDAFDGALIESAHEVANRLYSNNGKVVLDLPPAAVSLFKEDNKDNFYYGVIDQSGALVAGDAAVLQASVDKGDEGDPFRNGTIAGSRVRMAYVNKVPEVQGEKIIVVVAETTHKRQALANEILISVVAPQLVLIGLAALSVWVGVARGLAPLQTVRKAIECRNQWDLRPVTATPIPREVEPLVQAINDLLARLNKDIEAQRRFVANAAHQLRTPLAGLKTQSELALRQSDPQELPNTMNRIHQSVDRVTRLANQLLLLARLEPGATLPMQHSSFDLNPVAKSVAEELVPYALNKDIDLGFEGSDTPAKIEGDSVGVRELVSNLVDNAIRYTQQGGKVTVRIESNEGTHLYVEDDGPGIPETERERVFERFYRVLGNNVSGSGLGLAIVKEIADAHNAEVELFAVEQGRGTMVEVKFPCATA